MAGTSSTSASTSGSAPRLRADAARNRELLLAAAREAFAEHGLDVSMRQIAARAGVAEPTLRRRFASKEELVAEAFEDKVARYADLALAALDQPDAGAAFRCFLNQVMEMQLGDRGFADVLTITFPPTMACEQHRRRSYEAVERLIARAKDDGVLRPDFVAEDIVLVLLAHAGVVGCGGAVAGAFSARLRALLLQTFGLEPVGELPPAPSVGRVYHALMRLHDQKTTPGSPGG
ncbi:TetR/AcrR family transcriptional regulator [Sphaerimonospora sp. CA-214678]|uniref:TetR/AcrR family transcriptional regulator n=1 Tax=Sphaerimonospora sp. CA-214678 TaxID=3240029 RepID=UPI003D93A6BE